MECQELGMLRKDVAMTSREQCRFVMFMKTFVEDPPCEHVVIEIISTRSNPKKRCLLENSTF